MDATQEIRARLPIDELVSRYCQLQKKGRNFVALCPFHKDTHPSLLVSPDKGIAYCFACQTGGDVFSFYQAIEGVDFRQALKDLGERVGVQVDDRVPTVKKDEKERLRDVLQSALSFYREQLQQSKTALAYLADRSVPPEQIEQFQIGLAPDSFSATYEHLLKRGFSRKEILDAGMGVQKDLREERIYDRFRNRIMFPIHDGHGAIVGFGGRTLGDDDAKYINSSEGPLYRKSSTMFGWHHAKEAMRREKSAILVEGYFDVLACHRVGVTNAVATSGTALTEEHCKILKRTVESVNLCLDTDRAGMDAAERAYHLLSAEGLMVRSVELPRKDASELLASEPDLLGRILRDGGMPYLDRVLERLKAEDLSDPSTRRAALRRLLDILRSLPFAVERSDGIARAAAVFQTTPATLEEDLRRLPPPQLAVRTQEVIADQPLKSGTFSKAEIALALFVLYPKLRVLLDQLIPPEEDFAAALHRALTATKEALQVTLDSLPLPAEHRERAGLLMLFCEEHGLAEWSESLAMREIRKNCVAANREMLHRKQEEIARQLIAARAAHNSTEEALLQNHYQQVLKLRKMAG